MKNSLQNLLIFLALCLCGLAAFQWHREAKLRQELQSTSEDGRSKAEIIQNLQKTLRFAEEEVKRLGNLRSGIAATAESNRLEVGALKKQLETARREIEQSANRIETFKSALQQANANIQRQNESMKKLADERNQAGVKFNALVEQYNHLVNRWNDQPKALSATNPPAQK